METSAQPAINLSDLLKVKNTGTRIFRAMWDLVDYVIPPGGEDYLPFPAVASFFGDPRSIQEVKYFKDNRGLAGYIPDRSTEVRRLRLLYAHGFGDFTGKEGPEVVWEKDKIPQVRVETVRGERVYTVIDDPAGASVIAAVNTQADEQRLRSIVEQQGVLIRSLMERMGMTASNDLAEPGYAEIEEDTPPNIWDTATDSITHKYEPNPEADPEVFDDLPEDR